MHQPQERAHVIIPIWRKHQLLDHHQGMLPTLWVPYYIMRTSCASKFSKNSLEEGEKRTIWANLKHSKPNELKPDLFVERVTQKNAHKTHPAISLFKLQ